MIDNLVILKGRLTADVELKTTPNGKSVCSFTLAVDRGYGDNRATDFITCVAWEQRAEFISKYFNKGNEIRILGEINTRKWQDQNGNNRTAFEIRVQESGFCGSKNNNAQDNTQNSYAQPQNDFTEMGEIDGDLPFQWGVIMDKATQRNKILAYCEKHGSITVRDAFTELNINSPTKRISELRNSGKYTVRSVDESKTDDAGNKTRWKRYFIGVKQ